VNSTRTHPTPTGFQRQADRKADEHDAHVVDDRLVLLAIAGMAMTLTAARRRGPARDPEPQRQVRWSVKKRQAEVRSRWSRRTPRQAALVPATFAQGDHLADHSHGSP